MPEHAMPAAGDLRSADPMALRQAMSRIAWPVSVLTLRESPGVVHAVTLSSLISVSLEPPLVLFSLALAGSMARRLLDADIDHPLGLSFLSASQASIGAALARPDRPPVRSDWLCPLDSGPLGGAVIAGSTVQLLVVTQRRRAEGDHLVVTARVHATRCANELPLLYHERAFVGLAHAAARMPR
ncbi:MAG: flavin reductase family protein [Piscinibacter sp.]|nr:flavin reductase family protein [Piscinibacter sp.]